MCSMLIFTTKQNELYTREFYAVRVKGERCEVAMWGKYVAGLMEALMIAKCNNIIVLLKLKHEQQFII